MMVARRHSPWRWAGCGSLAVGLLLVLCFGVPHSWIDAFFSPLNLRDDRGTTRLQFRTMIIMPVVEIVPDADLPENKEKKPPVEVPESLRPDPAWWTSAWQVHVRTETQELLTPDPPAPVHFAMLTQTSVRGIMTRAEQDTSYATRVTLYEMREQERVDRVKHIWLDAAHQRQYQYLYNTGASLYGEFLFEEVSVPNPDDDEG